MEDGIETVLLGTVDVEAADAAAAGRTGRDEGRSRAPRHFR
jgi:hypothetical protein